jgi:hypothetical protein
MKGTLAELRQLQAAGQESTWGIMRHFGEGHLVLKSGEAAYVARCEMPWWSSGIKPCAHRKYL